MKNSEIKFVDRSLEKETKINFSNASQWLNERVLGNMSKSDSDSIVDAVEGYDNVSISEYGDGSSQVNFKGSFSSISFDIAPNDVALLKK